MMKPTEFVDRATATVAGLALYFTGMPDDEVTAKLAAMRNRLTTNLSEPFTQDVAAQLADAFTKAIASRRNEINAMTNTRTIQ
jgi:hypothetical protein